MALTLPLLGSLHRTLQSSGPSLAPPFSRFLLGASPAIRVRRSDDQKLLPQGMLGVFAVTGFTCCTAMLLLYYTVFCKVLYIYLYLYLCLYLYHNNTYTITITSTIAGSLACIISLTLPRPLPLTLTLTMTMTVTISFTIAVTMAIAIASTY